jgi:hypothetical protein
MTAVIEHLLYDYPIDMTLNATFDEAVRRPSIVGASAAIVRRSGIVWERHHGWGHREKKIPASADAIRGGIG